jgi:AcrR family transcriptional regulator
MRNPGGQVPRHPDPELEQRILHAASQLWRRSPKTLTMRAVARAAGTTTPTVYERYRDRDDILRSLRVQTRNELFSALRRTRSLQQACRRYLLFAIEHPHAYEVLFDGVGKPPSLHEPWPSFNLFRERLADTLGGKPRDHNRLMLALWSLMHGSVMLIIRGHFDDALRAQTIHACTSAFDAVIGAAQHSRLGARNAPKWPASLVLGEAEQSRVRHVPSKPTARKKIRPNRGKRKKGD